MFDAFSRFVNGIISHEASNHGGGSGGGGYRGQQQPEEEPAEQPSDLHLDHDSLRLSSSFKLSKLNLP